MSQVTQSGDMRLADKLAKMGARHLRSAFSDATLTELAALPWMPTKSTLCKYASGEDDSGPTARLYTYLLAMERAGLTREDANKLVVGLQQAIALAFGGERLPLRETLLRDSEADHAEEPLEKEAWREGLSAPALRRLLAAKREEVACGMASVTAITHKLSPRRQA